jgi:hypothetical protein
MGAEANDKGARETYHHHLGKMNETAYNAGNMSSCYNPAVLKMAASDFRNSKNPEKDYLKEVDQLRDHIIMEDNSSTSVKGYIQHISMVPFSIIAYSEEQLKLVSARDALYLDATGSICKKINGQSNRVLYYALVKAGAGKELETLRGVTSPVFTAIFIWISPDCDRLNLWWSWCTCMGEIHEYCLGKYLVIG